jgi:hypothetical protein
MSDACKCSIYQIPNIAFYQNTYIADEQKRMELMIEQDAMWSEFDIKLEEFNEKHQYSKYRKASFPDGWIYKPNKDDVFNRSGFYVNPQGENIVSVFMKDASYQVICSIKFLKRISSI